MAADFKHLMVTLWARFENRPELKRIIGNIGWMFADRAVRMSLGLFVGVWMARYLGPDQYGLFNYAVAIVALYGAIANVGLNSVIVRDLIREPQTGNATLGTAFLLQATGGLLAFALATLTAGYVRPNDTLAKLMIMVLGFAMVFKASEVVKYWFQSKVQSKFTVWAETTVFVAMSFAKAGLIIAEAPLIAFVWAALVEGALVALSLIGVYVWQGQTILGWCISAKRAKQLLKDGWPLMLSSVAIMIYMRIDQVMLGQMLGDEAVGVYSAAVRISELWYFIPTAIAVSTLPAIIEAKAQDELAYNRKLQQLYDFLALLAIAAALPMTFLSSWIIALIFGEAYSSAGPILALHIWTAPFVFLGVASSSWYLAENLQVLALRRTVMGAALNIGANFILIPRYGVMGAAIGTILSQAAASYFSDYLSTKTRSTFWMKTRSFYRILFFLGRTDS